jgi:hypothetical protein
MYLVEQALQDFRLFVAACCWTFVCTHDDAQISTVIGEQINFISSKSAETSEVLSYTTFPHQWTLFEILKASACLTRTTMK